MNIQVLTKNLLANSLDLYCNYGFFKRDCKGGWW